MHTIVPNKLTKLNMSVKEFVFLSLRNYLQMEQMLCARGYSDKLAGFASSSFLSAGILASVPIGLIASKLKKTINTTKVLMFIGMGDLAAIGYFLLVPDNAPWIITFCIIGGIVMIGYNQVKI